ncbi:MAG: hypothetical protein UZ09_BCD002000420 [Bacteroidetes bacterium OLB9]|nr:MAG: hypothetical protein UZ09_BCD002000420 [Bacteroidetes bacterium OLB9]
MDGLSISPLRGLLALWISSGYSLFIPSGLKKMTLKVNQENMRAIFHFGHKILFDGYLTASKFLCDGYVIESAKLKCNSLIISNFLSDGYVIYKRFLFDGYLIKVTK